MKVSHKLIIKFIYKINCTYVHVACTYKQIHILIETWGRVEYMAILRRN